MGSELLNLAPGPQRYASGADHGQNSTRTIERNTKRHFLFLLLLQMACAVKSNISWRKFLEYKVSDRTVNNSSFALSFNCQDVSFFKLFLLRYFFFYELRMRDILQ